MNSYSFLRAFLRMRAYNSVNENEGGFSMTTIQDVIDGKIDIPECERLLGVKVVSGDLANGKVTCEWTIGPQHLNRAGIALGGFTAAVADVAIGYAGALLVDANQGYSSINLQTTFHKPLFVGTALFHATIKRKGRSIMYAEVEIEQSGKLVGDTVSSLMILPKKA